MTAQIQDVFRYDGRLYEIAGISEGELFDPHDLGLEPQGVCTACWHGYQAVFAVTESRLVLDTLHVNLLAESGDFRRAGGPAIGGVLPDGPESDHDWFNNHYRGVRVPLEYTGGVLLADDFIEELYEHMGFHPAWKYREVLELVFEAGELRQCLDRTAQMEAVRAEIVESSRDRDPRGPRSDEDICAYIERAFDRRYFL